MSLSLGVNSWVTVAEADTYFSDRWLASGWAGLTNTEKEQLLITAHNWIQAQREFDINEDSTNTKVKKAQLELAWFIYNYFEETEKRRALYAQGVRDFKLSKWEETLEEGGFPTFILDMLSDEITGLGGYFPTITRNFN